MNYEDVKKGEVYHYGKLEELAENMNTDLMDFGPFLMGRHFIYIQDPEDETVASFLLTSYSPSEGAFLTCIYKDDE